MEKIFTVEGRDVGARLDKWLCQKLPKYSRKQIKALLDDGRVLINRRRVLIAGWELEDGDSVEVRIPPTFHQEPAGSGAIEDGEPTAEPSLPHPHRTHPANIGSGSVAASLEKHLQKKKIVHRESEHRGEERGGRLKLYFEDRDLLVVEKPAGILSVSHDGSKGESLLGMVRAYLKRKHKDSKGSFVHPLHRLDAETSGIMVFALSNVGRGLENQFRNHSIHREYVAIVAGKVPRDEGIIKRALEKGRFGGGRKVRAAEGSSGKQAVTEYRVGERYQNATMLNVKVRTGRTHQIRVHLASEGFPLIGDKTYAGGPIPIKFHRQALHAKTLGFKHPKGGKKMMFKSPLPGDMRRLVDELRTASTSGRQS